MDGEPLVLHVNSSGQTKRKLRRARRTPTVQQRTEDVAWIRGNLFKEATDENAHMVNPTTRIADSPNSAEARFIANAGDAMTDEALIARRFTFAELKKFQAAPNREGHTDVRLAIQQIDQTFGPNYELTRHAPTDRHGNREAHKPHQIIHNPWALSVYSQYRGGICADAMGTGKTHQILTLIPMMVDYQRRLKDEDHGPTLVVVPSVHLFSWRRTLDEALPDFKVIVYGPKQRQPGNNWDKATVSIGQGERSSLRMSASPTTAKSSS